jgi:hypothetical protein
MLCYGAMVWCGMVWYDLWSHMVKSNDVVSTNVKLPVSLKNCLMHCCPAFIVFHM